VSPERALRSGGREASELRPAAMEIDVSKFAEGSVLVSTGDTRVLVTASVENRVPGFLVAPSAR